MRTGVDGASTTVIGAVEELEERPLEEHVGVFEAAHAELRRALDARPPTADRARLTVPPDASGWTPSWYAAGWRGRVSTPAS